MLPKRAKQNGLGIGAATFVGLMLISVVAVASISPKADKNALAGSDKPYVGISAPSKNASLVAQAPTPTPSYIPWYAASPSPIPGAYAAIGAAFGAANIYNTGGAYPGSEMLDSGGCYFICYGAPGQQSHHMLAYGNDADPTAYTTQGAPNDCGSGAPSCPGGIANQVFSITFHGNSAPNGGYFVSLDKNANFAVYNKIVAGGAVIAGAGDGTPEPSPSAGSLVSYTGTNSSSGGEGDILLGSSGDYVKCDYGETTNQVLTCNQQLAATKGVQPNGASGGYAAETFPLGVGEQHPQILSGNCVASFGSSVVCTFPNSFAFASTGYNCIVTPVGSSPTAVSYEKTSTTQIKIHFGTAATFSYICAL